MYGVSVDVESTAMMTTRITVSLAAALIAFEASALSFSDVVDNLYYNDSLGGIIDVNALYGASDPLVPNAPEPDLSGVANLGAWLTDPASIGADPKWEIVGSLPGWPVNDENGIVYEFTLSERSDIDLSIGVDNGVFVWFNGDYQFGALAPGGASIGEYSVPIKNVAAGTHFLQILREDHGGSTGWNINGELTATPVPLPAAAPMLVAGLAALGFARRRRNA
jgi:hypothetical protein